MTLSDGPAGLRITLLSGSAAQTVVNLAVTGAAVPE